MNILLYTLASMVEVFLCLLSLAIVLRVLLPVLGSEEGALLGLCAMLSEPIVAPVRALLSKSEFFQSSPMDFSYTATILIILVINILMPTASTFL